MFERHAIFFTPSPGPLAAFGAAWLGWDSAAGVPVDQPAIAGLDMATLTATPRRYGLHGTLKAPFRLAEGARMPGLMARMSEFALAHAPVVLDALHLCHHHGFVALRPTGPVAALSALAADIVRDFDGFRAPPSADDIARRRRASLSPRQDRQMLDWGYPHVFDDFHFHLTLSGAVDGDTGAAIIAALGPRLDAILPRPFAIDAITLMGQDGAGMFHQIERAALAG